MKPNSQIYFYGNKIIELDSIPSSNDFLKELVSEKKIKDPQAVITEFQTRGRGQRNKFWESKQGQNILWTSFWPTDIPIGIQGQILMKIAVAVQSFLDKLFQENEVQKLIKIKWPNDLYVDDSKIGGMLIETSIQGDKISQLFLGIGLNILQTEFSKDVPNPSSLAIIKPSIDWDRSKIIANLASTLEQIDFNNTGDDLKSRYEKNMYGIGKIVCLESKSYRVEGISELGYLRLKNDLEVIEVTSSNHLIWF
jgi:BirA family transcriptional regulator, biotin operon repressor / biotin---[acetyl-CoA-carboxylase] ligase